MGCLDNTPPYSHHIICTGKGTHRRVEFRPTFSKGYPASDVEVAELLGDQIDPPGQDRWELYGHWRERGGTDLKASYRFACKYCGRDTQLGAAKLVVLLEGFNDAGRGEVDISALPF
jgi:hypothetical protein